MFACRGNRRGGVIYHLYYIDPAPLQRFCELPVMRFYGRASYSFYSNSILSIRIAGPLVMMLLGEETVRQHGLITALIGISLALAINTRLSWPSDPQM